MLSKDLFYGLGSVVQIFWGVDPADTGDYRNPDTMSTLELDEMFDPSSKAAQEYLQSFCDRLWANDFVSKPGNDYKCPINAFEDWLGEQADAAPTAQDDGYIGNCNGAGSLPMEEEYFSSCFIYWRGGPAIDMYQDYNVLERNGNVKIMWFEARSSSTFFDPYSELHTEWKNIEEWIQKEIATAPPGVNRMFQTNSVWWW